MNKLVKIAIIGLGQIGNYLYHEINSKKKSIELKTGKKIKIIAISAKNKNKKRQFKIDKKIFFSNPLKIFDEAKPDIVFEVIGLSDGISKKVVETALKKKINVITPNKSLIAKHGDYLAKLAEANNDLNGSDAFAKVRILSALSFNTLMSKSQCIVEGIENINIKDIKIANQLNLRIKLLGVSEIINGKLFETVHPCLVSKNSYIGNVNGVMNAVITNGKPVGESILQGEGAGSGPTSSSLLSDLFSILRGNIKKPFGISSERRKKIKTFDNSNYTNSLYLRFEVKDVAGVMSKISNKLAKFNISIKRLIQTPDQNSKKATIKNIKLLKPVTLIRVHN